MYIISHVKRNYVLMFKRNTISKIILVLLLIITNASACPVYEDPVPIADVFVNIDAKESKTSFSITWKFKEFFIQSLLLEHDKNKNGKFDKDEQKEIKDEWIKDVEENNYITQIVYVKKGQRVRKSLASNINSIDSELIFSNDEINYNFNFDTNFVLQDDNRLFIRFLDPNEKISVSLKDIVLNNYSDKKVIVAQDIRANIYFYDFVPNYTKKKAIKVTRPTLVSF